MKKALYKISLLMLGIFLTGQLALAQNPDPEVTVLDPNGSEEWVIGNTYWISWTDNFSQGVDIVLLKYDLNGNYIQGAGSKIIDSNISGSTYTWTITDDSFYEDDRKYKIAVRSHVATNFKDYSDEFFYIVDVPSDASITLLQPMTVSNIPINSTYWISWEDNFDDKVRIELYKDGSPVDVLSPDGGAQGSVFQWVIGNDANLIGDGYQIRVAAYNSDSIADISTDEFSLVYTIDGTIELFQPTQSGIEIQNGSKYLIVWNDNLTEKVKIELTDANGDNPELIANNVTGTTYSWNTAVIPEDLENGNYKIKISSSTDPSVTPVLSQYSFLITDAADGTIAIEQPEAGTIWEIGNSYWISWVDNVPGKLKIELYNQAGDTKVADIATNVVGSTYVWNTSLTANLTAETFYKIRVSTLDDNDPYQIEDFSADVKLVEASGEIDVLQPDIANIEWVIGQTYLISWMDDISDPVNIDLVSDNPITFAFDEASNYTTASWVHGSNEGFGFEPWIFIDQEGNGETFVSDPATGHIPLMDNPSFGIVANGDQTGVDLIHVGREFSKPMDKGSTFSFDWGIWGASGSKGIRISRKIANNHFEVLADLHIELDEYGDTILIADASNNSYHRVFTGKGDEVMHFSFEYTLDGQLRIQSNSRNGIEGDFDLTIDVAGAPALFSAYAADQLEDGQYDLHRANWFNNLKIEGSYINIAENVTGSTYDWNTSGYDPGSYKIRVYKGESENLSANSFELVSSAGGTITFNQPQLGDIWVRGQSYWVAWEDTFMEPLNVYLKKVSDANYELPMRTNFEGSAFDYTVPGDLEPNTDYYIQIESSVDPSTGSFNSPNFTIVSSMPGTITINQPNGGELIYLGQAYWIVWETDISEKVKITLFDDEDVVGDRVLTPDGGVYSSAWVWNVANDIPQLNTYKIRIESIDEFSLTPPVESAGVFEISEPIAMSVYPNPASDLFNVRFDNQTDGVFDAVIYDRFNNRMLETRLDAATKLHTINIAQLPEGIYFLKMTSGKKVISQKIVVKH